MSMPICARREGERESCRHRIITLGKQPRGGRDIRTEENHNDSSVLINICGCIWGRGYLLALYRRMWIRVILINITVIQSVSYMQHNAQERRKREREKKQTNTKDKHLIKSKINTHIMYTFQECRSRGWNWRIGVQGARWREQNWEGDVWRKNEKEYETGNGSTYPSLLPLSL